MEYKQENNRFYVISSDGFEIAEMTFTRINSDKATIDHTFVDANYRRQGIADKLLSLVVEKLQQEKREIIPICSFAVKKLNKQ